MTLQPPKVSEGVFWKIPLTRVMLRSTLGSHFDALMQLVLILLTALAPILISALIDAMHIVSLSNEKLSFGVYFSQIDANFQLGELFIYVATFCAPIAWILIKYNRAGRPFDDFITFIITGGCVWTLAVVFFVLYRIHYFMAWTSVSTMGYALFFIIIGLTYVALVYEGNLRSFDDYEKTQNKSAIDLQERLTKLRH